MNKLSKNTKKYQALAARLPPRNFLEEFVKQLEKNTIREKEEEKKSPIEIKIVELPKVPEKIRVKTTIPEINLEMLATLLKMVCSANTASSVSKINKAAISAVEKLQKEQNKT